MELKDIFIEGINHTYTFGLWIGVMCVYLTIVNVILSLVSGLRIFFIETTGKLIGNILCCFTVYPFTVYLILLTIQMLYW